MYKTILKGKEIILTEGEYEEVLLQAIEIFKSKFKKVPRKSLTVPPRGRCKFGIIHASGEGCWCWVTPEERKSLGY